MIGWAQIDTVKIELTPTSISYKLKEPNLVLERAQIRPYLDQLVTTLIADDYLEANIDTLVINDKGCLLYTSPSPRD